MRRAGPAAGRAAPRHAAGRRRPHALDLRERQVGPRLSQAHRCAWCRWPRRCRPSRSRNCRARSTRRAITRGQFDARPLLAAGAGRPRRRAAQRGRHAGRRRPGLLRGARRARAGHRGGAAHRAGVAAARTGGQRTQRPELRLRRLPAAGRRSAHAAHPRTRIARAADRPDPALHRNALPQCGPAPGPDADAAAQHPPRGGPRAHARERRHPQRDGEGLARQAIAVPTTACPPCSRSDASHVRHRDAAVRAHALGLAYPVLRLGLHLRDLGRPYPDGEGALRRQRGGARPGHARGRRGRPAGPDAGEPLDRAPRRAGDGRPLRRDLRAAAGRPAGHAGLRRTAGIAGGLRRRHQRVRCGDQHGSRSNSSCATAIR